MDPIGAGAVHRADFLGKPTEIGRQDRRRHNDRASHGYSLVITG
jgi:hypothetical protein